VAREEMDLDAFLGELKGDDEYKKFREILRNTRTKLNIEKDRTEAFVLMSGRSARSLHGKKQFSPRALMEASANDLSARARLVEIRMRAKVHIDLLAEAGEALKAHIFTEYSDIMRLVGTSEHKKALVDRVQKTAKTLIAEANALIELLDQIIKDIDSASFQLRNIMETLKLLDGTKGKIV
jgi:hypothetical protein